MKHVHIPTATASVDWWSAPIWVRTCGSYRTVTKQYIFFNFKNIRVQYQISNHKQSNRRIVTKCYCMLFNLPAKVNIESFGADKKEESLCSSKKRCASRKLSVPGGKEMGVSFYWGIEASILLRKCNLQTFWTPFQRKLKAQCRL